MSHPVDKPRDDDAHDCAAAGTLTYEGEYGAPGVGQAWRCTACGKAWSRLGDVLVPAEWGLHILTLDDVI